MARLVPTMLPTITPRPRRARLGGHRKALGEAAALVELDVDDVEAANERLDVGEAQDAFVGGDRDRAAESVELRFAPAREWLLDELDLAGDEIRHERARGSLR